jgi:hypothetical protein
MAAPTHREQGCREQGCREGVSGQQRAGHEVPFPSPPRRIADAVWHRAILTLAGLIVLGSGWRLYEDRTATASLRPQPLAIERQGPAYVVELAAAPELGTRGGVVAVRSGRFCGQVVRVGALDYAAYTSRSREGRRVDYDPVTHLFVSRGSKPVWYEPETGQVLAGPASDQLVPVPVRVVGHRLVVTPLR